MDTEARAQIAASRKAQGLSLRELASRVGISASQLSQIESGKSEPSVASLFALVNELGLSLDSLVGAAGRTEDALPGESRAVPAATAGATDVLPRQQPAARARRVHRTPEDYQVLHLDTGVVWERLVAPTKEILEALRVTYRPGGRSSSDGSFSRHEGSEFIFMLSGSLTVQLRFETFDVGAGETLLFRSSDPHYFVNNTDEPAVGLWLILADAGLEDAAPPLAALAALHVDNP